MTIEVTHYNGVHQGGTKEYSIYLFRSTETKRALLVKRWGKVGVDGQVKHEVCTGNGDKEMNAALKERSAKGYDMRHDAAKSRSYDDIEDAIEITLPTVHRNTFYNNQLALLDPKGFSKEDRMNYDPFKRHRAGIVDKAQQVNADKQREEIEAQRLIDEEALQSNPHFGMF